MVQKTNASKGLTSSGLASTYTRPVDANQDRRQYRSQQSQLYNFQLEPARQSLTPSPLQSSGIVKSVNSSSSSIPTSTSLTSSSLPTGSSAVSNECDLSRLSPRKRLAACYLTDESICSGNQSSVDSPAAKAVLNHRQSKDASASLTNPPASGLSSAHDTCSSSSLSKVMSNSNDNNANTRPIPARTSNRNAMPRNPSIESAVSSISSASHSFKSNSSLPYRGFTDTNATSPDIGGLISAAGSAEGALQGLWKEKQSASAHNSQLWRLVEKQRAMILGLNKDLERALKDKERYRKKLKEHLSQVPPLPNSTQRVDSALDRDTSQSPAFSDNVEDQTQQGLKYGMGNSPPHSLSSSTVNNPDSDSRIKTSIADGELSPQISPVDQNEEIACQRNENVVMSAEIRKKEKSTTMSFVSNQLTHSSPDLTPASVPSESSMEGAHSPRQNVIDSQNTKYGPPTVAITSATPTMENRSPQSAFNEKAPGLRKAPPKPLDLSKGTKVSAHLQHRACSNDKVCDDDDILETKDVPNFERGRRKTREEDDVARETIVMQQEQEQEQHRSRSKKDKKIKVKGADKDDDAAPPLPSPLSDENISPKTILPRGNHAYDLNMVSSPGSEPASIGAMLMGSGSESALSSPRRTDVPAALVSPGLPQSPRPCNKGANAVQPRSPRQNLGSPTTGSWPNPATHTLSPRAPREPIPAPPMSPLALSSPHLARAEGYAIHMASQVYEPPPSYNPPAPPQQEQQIAQKTQNSQKQNSGLLRPAATAAQSDLSLKSDESNITGDTDEKEQIYRGFVSEQHPDLLLPPSALPLINVRVFSSRLRPPRWSFMVPDPQTEDPVFILAVTARSDGKQLWMLEKTIIALPTLDQQIKQMCDFRGKLPERGLFQGHAPAKIDGRRSALNSYFGTLLETPMDFNAAKVVCEFFSTDVIGIQGAEPQETANTVGHTGNIPSAVTASKSAKHRKEGYLTKRGKNFGGWKARYFVLDGSELRYYETYDGAHLGTIKLQSAQIGKQSSQASSGNSPSRPKDDDPENQYRHAFLILEPKRKDSKSLVRHVLCAESDEERDSWVELLLKFVDPSANEHEGGKVIMAQSVARKEYRSPARSVPNKIRREQGREQQEGRGGRDTPDYDKQESMQNTHTDSGLTLHASNHESMEPANYEDSSSDVGGHNPSPALYYQHQNISGPSNGAPIHNAESWGNKASSLGVTSHAKEKEGKKRNLFGFRGKGSDNITFQNGHSPSGLQSQAQPGQFNATSYRHGQVQYRFGMPLAEAVAIMPPLLTNREIASSARGPDTTYLPAVVYRCLEYLNSKDAASEEGIFRLSGSNIVIRNLRMRFENEGDVRLLDDEQYHDIHAVASLLKLYLRELPVSILTRELHLDFLKVLGALRDISHRITFVLIADLLQRSMIGVKR